MSDKRVVITGFGAVTPIGLNAPDFWNALKAGKSAGAPITGFDASRHKVKFACEIKDYNADNFFDRKESRRIERFVQFAIVATREAVAHSGLNLDELGRDNIGVVIGSGIGGLSIMEEQIGILIAKGPERVSPLLIPKMICNMAPGQVAIALNLRGPNNCPVTACATGSNAIGDAAMMIRAGQAVAMVAGGTEAAITPLGIAGFSNMTALSERNDDPARASRPFSKDRDGFVMGEGAGIVVLEDYEHAKARGATIYAEVAGYGLACDAYHITGVAPDHEGQQRSMKMALKQAGLQPHEIQHINAHATSTPLNDKNESAAIKAVFGDHAQKLAISANKSSIGHLLGAAGGVEAVATIMAIAEGVVAPTINFSERDPECDLDYVVDGARKLDVQAAISNSSGFGGHNVSVLFKKV